MISSDMVLTHIVPVHGTSCRSCNATRTGDTCGVFAERGDRHYAGRVRRVSQGRRVLVPRSRRRLAI